MERVLMSIRKKSDEKIKLTASSIFNHFSERTKKTYFSDKRIYNFKKLGGILKRLRI